MKPLFMWAGGKNKMLKHYLSHMPDSIDSYCEPFFGGGAMFIHVINTYNPPSVVINDINADIISIYSSIKYDLSEFLSKLDELEDFYIPLDKPTRKKYYYQIRHEHAFDYNKWSKVEEAAVLYFLMKTSFNGIFQINKNTNNRYGTPCGLLNQNDRIYDLDVVKWWHYALQRTDIRCSNWKDAVKNLPKTTFYFLDPPYRASFANYGNAFTDQNLLELIDFADSQQSVMLTNRDDDGWFEENHQNLSFFHIDTTYTAGRRKITDNGFKAKKAKEILLYRTERLTLENFIRNPEYVV